MRIDTAMYTGSFAELKQCPSDERPEIAFTGRSNVGKSSLINMLTGRKNLAKTSNRPGKTQTMNYFLINGRWYLVDLPGYGYAGVAKTRRAQWDRMVKHYLQKRETLLCVFQLVDATIPPQAADLAFTDWLGAHHIPFALVFTKCDKKPKKQVHGRPGDDYLDAMRAHWENFPEAFSSSAKTNLGKTEIEKFIGALV